MNKRNLKWVFGGLSIALVAVTIFFASNAAMAQDEADPSNDTKIENVENMPSADAGDMNCKTNCDFSKCSPEEIENCMEECESSCKLGGDKLKEEFEEGDC